MQDSTPARVRVFLKDPDADQEAKICEKPDQDLGHFSISAVAGGDFLSKNMGKLHWIDDCSRGLDRSRILKFEELLYLEPDPDSKILEQERSRSLKK